VSPWRVILATMVIFACGVITGAMVTRTVAIKAEEHPMAAATATVTAATNPPTRMAAGSVWQMQRAEFFKRLDKEVDLSAEQHEQIGKILKASQERTQPLWVQIAPQMDAELKKVREEIRAALTPEQRKKFAEMMKGNRKPNTAPPGNGPPSRSPESTASATNDS
jgi:Spy/CpxP family protein refolding chaperone